MTIFILLLTFLLHTASSLQATSTPPLLDVPTYSLATTDSNGRTGMNILTYASPASTKPDRVWTIGLFRGTVAHENFSRTGEGVLQLLMPCHSPLVKLLGGSSGRDVDKRHECGILGFPWRSTSDDDDETDERGMPELLPHCAYYLRLTRVGDLIDCGSHDVAVCRVDSMLVPDETEAEAHDGVSRDYLNTALLREMGIITAQGRVAD